MAETAPHAATTEAHGSAPHAEPTAFGMDATQWVALAMIAVLAILIWKKVPAAIGTALDRKIATIRDQLEEARQLRAEAEALKAEYEAKAAAADAEAATMIERRTRIAESKIAAAERAAIDQVRARAATAAAAAAARLIEEELDAEGDKAMVDETIAGLGQS